MTLARSKQNGRKVSRFFQKLRQKASDLSSYLSFKIVKSRWPVVTLSVKLTACLLDRGLSGTVAAGESMCQWVSGRVVQCT